MRKKHYESPDWDLIRFNFAELMGPYVDASGETPIGDGDGKDPGDDLT